MTLLASPIKSLSGQNPLYRADSESKSLEAEGAIHELALEILAPFKHKKSVRFSPYANFCIRVDSEKDPVHISGLILTNFQDRVAQTGLEFNSCCFRRPPTHRIPWPLNKENEFEEYEPFKNLEFDSHLLGPYVTLGALLEAGDTYSKELSKPWSLDYDYLQASYAISNELNSIYDDSFIADLIADYIIDFIQGLEELPKKDIRAFSLSDLYQFLCETLDFKNKQSCDIDLSSFANLIQIKAEDQKISVIERRSLVKTILHETSGDLELLPICLVNLFPWIEGPVNYLADPALKNFTSIPQDLMNAPEFDEAVVAFHDGSWSADITKTFTLTQFKHEDLSFIKESLKQLFKNPLFQKFMYCWRGLI
jgi:hypothetical protein